jgi:ribose 5-phosphate isomerase B
MVKRVMAVIALGADHAGLPLKEVVKVWLHGCGHEVLDVGTHTADSVDYPDYAALVADALLGGSAERGILVCGTGIGMAITANKVPGVRAAQVADAYSAERARKSNNAQVMALGARTVAPEVAKTLVDHWLASEFEGGRSAPKVEKMDAVDRRHRGERAGSA